jgi:hypothetical protein
MWMGSASFLSPQSHSTQALLAGVLSLFPHPQRAHQCCFSTSFSDQPQPGFLSLRPSYHNLTDLLNKAGNVRRSGDLEDVLWPQQCQGLIYHG